MLYNQGFEPSIKDANIVKFTNCHIVQGQRLVTSDLWVDSQTGKILDGQKVFFDEKIGATKIIDLEGDIISPGFIDTQINGAFGFDFSVARENSIDYVKGLNRLRKSLVKTGVTSFLPTLTSQRPELYRKVLPYLQPSSLIREACCGAESLGAHCEGPFLNQSRNGIHSQDVLKQPCCGLESVEDCYGQANLDKTIKMVTLAPELSGSMSAIRELRQKGIIVSIGHTTATFECTLEAMAAGATTVTHLFNAMEPLHHRNPGIFGVLGDPDQDKPYFGIIADGIHLHPSCLNIAWHTHPQGLILVTDAMSATGLDDGLHHWTNGEYIEKKGHVLHLKGSGGRIAGSAITMIECINNFINWTGASIVDALNAATKTPAKMLNLEASKGTLEAGADADLVILRSITQLNGHDELEIQQVWKFGQLVFKLE